MFLWDSANVSHLAIHKVSPREAEEVIANSPFDLERQIRNEEERMVHLGETDSGSVLIVVTTMRGNLIRVVTAFPANRAVRKFYSEQKELRDAQNS